MALRSSRASLALWLMWRDLLAEKTMAFCLVAGLTATLVPLLLLAGLRAGMVEGMRQHLLSDPHMREVTSASNRPFNASWLEQMRERPDVAFLVPKTRTLAASVRITPQGGDIFSSEDSELAGTAPHDPLPGQAAITAEFDDNHQPELATTPIPAIFSTVLATRLHAFVGATLMMSVSRLGQGAQSVEVPLVVKAISPRNTTDRTLVFVPLAVAQGIEDFRENTPPLSWEQALQRGREEANSFLNARLSPQHALFSNIPTPEEKSWPGFRLYTRDLESVQKLDTLLLEQHVSVTDEAGKVGDVLRLDAQTHLLILLLAALSISGFIITLGAGVWASVERKRLTLATMRFLGTPRPELLPVVQAELLALCAAVFALSIAQGSAMLLNHLFDGALPEHHPVCLISWSLCLEAAFLTTLAALLAASAAAWKASRLQPWDGVSAP